MVGFLPTGKIYQGHEELISLFWSIRYDHIEGLKAKGIDWLKNKILHIIPTADLFINQICSIEDLTYARYFDVILKTNYSNRVLFIGDSAHAMSPQLGQGTNLALLDAMIFSDLLEQYQDIDLALRKYDLTRKNHLKYYQWITRVITPFFQSSNPLYSWIRNFSFPLMNKFSFSKKMMLESMVGIKQGVWKKSLSLKNLDD